MPTQTTPRAAVLADPDHDGIPNLLEYALYREPKSSNTTPPTVAGTEVDSVSGNTYLTLTYSRLIVTGGVTFTVEVSSDLATRNSGSNYSQDESVTDDGNGATQTIKVRILPALSSSASVLFARLRVSY